MDVAFRKVKPVGERMVRFPRNYAILPTEGAVVPWTGADGRYWRRRLSAGDIEIIEQKEERSYNCKKKNNGEMEENK